MHLSSGYKRLLIGAASLIFSVELSAQTTVYSEGFEVSEGETIGQNPDGWVYTGGSGSTSTPTVRANPVTGGSVNPSPSAQSLRFESGGSSADWATNVIDLSSYVTGQSVGSNTFTLSFDMLDTDQTTAHSLIFGLSNNITPDHPGVVWIGSNGVSVINTVTFQLDAVNTWQTFTFDITADINSYLDGTGVNLANDPKQPDEFALIFQSVSSSVSHQPYLDNISLTAVPEPSSYAAIFGGLALIGTLARRRRRSV